MTIPNTKKKIKMKQVAAIKQWRKDLRKFGREYVIIEDMVQLGFLKMERKDLEEMRDAMAKINQLRTENWEIQRQLNELGDLQSLLKKVRSLRIQRVKKERAERKIKKAKAYKEKKAAEKNWRTKTPPYLGQGVSAGLHYINTDVEKLKKQDLPILENAADLAEAIGLETKQISWLCYHRSTASIDHYRRFKIPKSKGGFRTIASPKPMMRQAQFWILQNILSKIALHDAAMAFRPNRSIVQNAEIHQNGGVIIRMDLKDFFPSIKFPRVKGIFKSFGYNEGVATMLSLLCTDSVRMKASVDGQKYFVALGDRFLPQGACTSPALTNIICRKMDNRLDKLSKKFDFIYTRYADDLIFSHPNKNANLKPILNCTQKIIREENFTMHPDKLMIMRPHNRQSVTGIVVNEKLTISRKDRRKFRSFLHHFQQQGHEALSLKMNKNVIDYGKGYFAFINMVNSVLAERIAREHTWLIK